MRLFKVVNYTDATHYQLEPTGETYGATEEFVRHAENPANKVTYAGSWQLQGKTESIILTFGIITKTQCELIGDGFQVKQKPKKERAKKADVTGGV